MLRVPGFVRLASSLGSGVARARRRPAVAPAVFVCVAAAARAAFFAARPTSTQLGWCVEAAGHHQAWLLAASRAQRRPESPGSYVRSQNAAAYCPRGLWRPPESARQVKPAIPAMANLGDSILRGWLCATRTPTHVRCRVRQQRSHVQKYQSCDTAKQRRATLYR